MKNIAIILLLISAMPAFAQHDNMMDFMPDITHAIGGSYQKFNGLNGRIANFPQYKQLPNYAATLELGWFKEHGQVITMGGFTAGSSMGADHDKRSSNIRFIGVHLDLGYNLLRSGRVLLYPMVGLGLEKYQARFFRDNSAVDFDDVLNSPTAQNNIHSLDLTNGFFNYRAGFGVAFRNPKYPSSTLGIQAGYTGSFTSNPWKSNQTQSFSNAPEDRLSRFFVALIVTGRPGMGMHAKNQSKM